MPIRFTCPHCSTTTDVARQYVGRSGPCVGCGRMVTVPPPDGTPGYRPPGRSSHTAVAVVIVMIIGGLAVLLGGLGYFFYRVAGTPASAPQRMPRGLPTGARVTPFTGSGGQCRNNLQRIGSAMRAYHDQHGTFPPAYVTDDRGRPMHSWRALLLPHLGEPFLATAYDFRQPWNSPQNRALAQSMPSIYRCPEDYAAGGGVTSYVMIVGPGTISDGTAKTGIQEVKDSPRRTFLVVESTSGSINWLEPSDLDAEQMSYQINSQPGNSIRSNNSWGAHVLFCDGSVHGLSSSTSPQHVKAMTTIAGSESVSVVFRD